MARQRFNQSHQHHNNGHNRTYQKGWIYVITEDMSKKGKIVYKRICTIREYEEARTIIENSSTHNLNRYNFNTTIKNKKRKHDSNYNLDLISEENLDYSSDLVKIDLSFSDKKQKGMRNITVPRMKKKIIFPKYNLLTGSCDNIYESVIHDDSGIYVGVQGEATPISYNGQSITMHEFNMLVRNIRRSTNCELVTGQYTLASNHVADIKISTDCLYFNNQYFQTNIVFHELNNNVYRVSFDMQNILYGIVKLYESNFNTTITDIHTLINRVSV